MIRPLLAIALTVLIQQAAFAWVYFTQVRGNKSTDPYDREW